MTTRITIKNEGPGIIQVAEEVNYNTAGPTPAWLETKHRRKPMEPGESVDVYGYADRRYVITEVPL